MDRQISEDLERVTINIVIVDILVLNILFGLGVYFGWMSDISLNWLFFNVAYLITIFFRNPIAQNRTVSLDQVTSRGLWSGVLMSTIYIGEILIDSIESNHITNRMPWWLIPIGIIVALILSRFFSRMWVKSYRRSSAMKRNAIFVGAGVNLKAIYNRLAKDLTTGYVIQGYFEDHVSEHLGEELPRLGDVSDVVTYLNENKGKVDLVFCNQPDSMAESVREIVRCCENNLIHFYTVPNVNNFLNRRMTVQYVDDMPVFTMRDEPLRLPHNRAIKRLFDIFASLLFLVLIFWWVYIIVAIITKITMPGPVLFKQKRSGDHRKEFTCLKFRSMKVNDQADLVQATKNDPRKTKWGNFLRKTSIDEFPQFINVLRNDMSIVGPRPHMLKHTEEYSKIIDKYMVRHYAKPGITGWAQVKGFRGETPETWMMEERIKKDIWYIEHWTFMLDIKIIFMTIFNWMGKEKGNAY